MTNDLKNATQLLILSALSVAVAGCGFTIPKGGSASSGSSSASDTSGNTGNTGNSTGASGGATFQQVSSQILQPKCVSCHNSGGSSPDLSSYAAFAQDTRYVIAGNANQSAVYTAVASGNMPRSGTPLTSDQLSLMAAWINDGAQNN